MLRVIGKSGYRRSSMPGCAGVPSYSINSWMDYRDCDEPCAPSYWRRAGNTKLRNYSVRFTASDRFEPPLDRADANPATVFAASGNCGPTVAWALRPTTVRNTAMWGDNCNVRKNRNRFVVSIRITTTK